MRPADDALPTNSNTPTGDQGFERTVADRERTSSDSTHPVSHAVPIFGQAGLPDRYEVLRTLGAGATGRVLAVRDNTFDREVAVKMLLGSDGMATARFIREARITANLEHPNILPVYDLEFTATGGVFFTMRKVNGTSLGEALRLAAAGTPPPQVASVNDRINIILKACDALSKAHSCAVVHQDVKPDNIMLGSHGEVLLVDWGEARVMDESQTSSAHRMVGTPAFMSPEQARGQRADERSDIYCLGATLFHALVFRHPILEDNPERFWNRKRAGDIDPLTLRESVLVPKRLQAILLKAMAASPEHRYGSVDAFAKDLRAYQAGQAVAAYRESFPERLHRYLIRHARQVTMVATLVAVTGTAGWVVWGERLKEIASWGAPVVIEHLGPRWEERWVPMLPGMFGVKNGRLTAQGATEFMAAMWKEPIHTAVAVECTVTMEPGAVAGDVGILYVCGDTPPAWADLQQESGRRAFEVMVSGYYNTTATMTIMPARQILASRPFSLVPGRPYQVRIEIDGTRLTLDVDGHRLLDHTEPFPLGPGYLGLRTRFGGKSFGDLRVYRKGTAEKVSVLAIGDSNIQDGQPALAAKDYRRVAESHPGTPLGDEARWREGLAREMAGDDTGADAAWSRINDPTIQPRVEVHRLKRRLLKDEEGAWSVFPDLYARHPELRHDLRVAWSAWVSAYAVDPPPPTPHRLRAVQLKDTLFPDDVASDANAARLRFRMRAYEDVVRLYPEEKRWQAYALIHLGRFAEAEAQIPELYTADLDARWSLGQYQRVIDGSRYTILNKVHALLRLERIDEAKALCGDRPTPDLLLVTGQAEAARVHPEATRTNVNAALWLLDRTQEAMISSVGKGRIGSAPFGPLLSDEPAAVILNRATEAQPSALVLAARIRGDRLGEAEARKRLAANPIDKGYDQYWFEELVLPVILDRLDGQEAPLKALSARLQGDLQGLWAGQADAFIGYLTGTLNEAGFLAQPTRRDARIWLPLVRALRAEFADDIPTALREYRAWAARPRWERLLTFQFSPNPEAERLVAWRLEVLGGGKAP